MSLVVCQIPEGLSLSTMRSYQPLVVSIFAKSRDLIILHTGKANLLGVSPDKTQGQLLSEQMTMFLALLEKKLQPMSDTSTWKDSM